MPDTTSYLIMALLATGGLVGGLIASIRLRYLQARKAMRLVEQLAGR